MVSGVGTARSHFVTLLFNHFVSDINKSVKYSTFVIFAVDVNI